jgi:WD40 repeat protein
MSNVMAIHHGSMDRKILATGSMDCHVKLWSTDTKEALNSFRGHKGEVRRQCQASFSSLRLPPLLISYPSSFLRSLACK